MRLPLFPIIVVLIVGILIDWRILHGRIFRVPQRKKLKLNPLGIAYIVISAIVTIGLIAVVSASKKGASESWMSVFMWALFAYFSIYVPKYIYELFLPIQKFLGWIFRRRLRGIAVAGAVVAFALFVMMWWGALVTRNSIDVRDVDVEISGLPPAFRGYRIVQLSDIHTGTFGTNPRFLEKVVARVNSLNPDIILFTGDIVNRHSSELEPFMPVLAQLKAPDGVWSVMGNHDYGEYYRWPSEADRLADVRHLKEMQARMGWHMLNNGHTVLRRGNDSIVVVGVENIGDPPFTTYGDLHRAYPVLSDSATKILLTHNPAHWTDSIAGNPDMNVAFTLSGHTHAMQIRLLGWSPAKMRYPTWGGLYADSLGRKLYVNIGIGEVGFPSRIGATPEVTLITLTDR